MRVDIANLGLSSLYGKGDLISKLLMTILFSLVVMTLFSVSSRLAFATATNASINNVTIITDTNNSYVANYSSLNSVKIIVGYNDTLDPGAIGNATYLQVNVTVTEPDGDKYRCSFYANSTNDTSVDAGSPQPYRATVWYNSTSPCYKDDGPSSWTKITTGSGNGTGTQDWDYDGKRGRYVVEVADNQTARCTGNTTVNTSTGVLTGHAGLCNGLIGNRTLSTYWIAALDGDIVVRTVFDPNWLVNKSINGTRVRLTESSTGYTKELTDGGYLNSNNADHADGWIIFTNASWSGTFPTGTPTISIVLSEKSGFSVVSNSSSLTYSRSTVNDLYSVDRDIEFGVGLGQIGVRVINFNGNELTGASVTLFNGTAAINQTVTDSDNDGYLVFSNGSSWSAPSGNLGGEAVKGTVKVLSVSKTGFNNVTTKDKSGSFLEWNVSGYLPTARNYPNSTGHKNLTMGANIQINITDWAGSGLLNVSVDLRTENDTARTNISSVIATLGNTSSTDGIVTFLAGVNFTESLIDLLESHPTLGSVRMANNDTFTVAYKAIGFQNYTAETSAVTTYSATAQNNVSVNLGADINVTVRDWAGLRITGATIYITDNNTNAVTDNGGFDGDRNNNGFIVLVADTDFNYTQVSTGFNLSVYKSGFQGNKNETNSNATYVASAINIMTVDLGSDIVVSVEAFKGSLNVSNATVYLAGTNGIPLNSTFASANARTEPNGNYTFVAGRDFTKAQMCGAGNCDIITDAEFKVGASKSGYYGGMINYSTGIDYIANQTNRNDSNIVHIDPDIVFTLTDWAGNRLSGATVKLSNSTKQQTLGNGTFTGAAPYSASGGVYIFVAGVNFLLDEINRSSAINWYNISYSKAGFRNGTIGNGTNYTYALNGNFENRTARLGADIQINVTDWSGAGIPNAKVVLFNVTNAGDKVYEISINSTIDLSGGVNTTPNGVTNTSGYVYLIAGEDTKDPVNSYNFTIGDINPTTTTHNKWNATVNATGFNGGVNKTFNALAYSATGLNTVNVVFGSDIRINVTDWAGTYIDGAEIAIYNQSGYEMVHSNVTRIKSPGTGITFIIPDRDFNQSELCGGKTYCAGTEKFYVKIRAPGYMNYAWNTSGQQTYNASAGPAYNNVTNGTGVISGNSKGTYEMILGTDLLIQARDWDSNGIGSATVTLYWNTTSGSYHVSKGSKTTNRTGHATFVAGTDFNFPEYINSTATDRTVTSRFIIQVSSGGFQTVNWTDIYNVGALDTFNPAMNVTAGYIGVIVKDWSYQGLLNDSLVQLKFRDKSDGDYIKISDGDSSDQDGASNGRVIISGLSGWTNDSVYLTDQVASDGQTVNITLQSGSGMRSNATNGETYVASYSRNESNHAQHNFTVASDINVTIRDANSAPINNVTVHLFTQAGNVVAVATSGDSNGVYTFYANDTSVTDATDRDFDQTELVQGQYIWMTIDADGGGNGTYKNATSSNVTYNISAAPQSLGTITLQQKGVTINARLAQSYTTGYAGGDYANGWWFNFTVNIENAKKLRWRLDDWKDTSSHTIAINTTTATQPLSAVETNAYMQYTNKTGANSTYFIGNGWDELQGVTELLDLDGNYANNQTDANVTIWMKIPSGATAGQYWTTFEAGAYR